MVKTIKFGPFKDSFGYNSLKSFVDHVDYYQSVQSILINTPKIKFEFGSNGIPVYDIFEFHNNKKIEFDSINVIVVETLRQFQTIVRLLDKEKEYIIFSESFWDTKKYNFDINYRLVYMPWDIVDCQNRLANRSSLYFHLLDLNFFPNYDPQYTFLCLAGRSKNWRDVFIDKLVSQIDLSNTLTSYYGNCLGNTSLLEIDLDYDRSSSKSEFESKFYQPIQVPDSIHKYNLSYFTKNQLFYLTKFSLIVETEAEFEEYHVTEKTLKCIMLGHPFVVIGTPGYLKFLHSLGFTTYSELFDESYDSIIDLNRRMDAVIELTKNLCNQNFNINKLKEIQDKNLNALIKLRDADIYKNFLDLFNK